MRKGKGHAERVVPSLNTKPASLNRKSILFAGVFIDLRVDSTAITEQRWVGGLTFREALCALIVHPKKQDLSACSLNQLRDTIVLISMPAFEYVTLQLHKLL